VGAWQRRVWEGTPLRTIWLCAVEDEKRLYGDKKGSRGNCTAFSLSSIFA